MYKVVKENPIWVPIKIRFSRKDNYRHFQKSWNYKRSLRICLCHVHFPLQHPPWFQSTDSRAKGRSLAFFQAYKAKHTCKPLLNLNLWQVFKNNGKTWMYFWEGKLVWQYCGLRITENKKKTLLSSERNIGFGYSTERKQHIFKAENYMQTKLQLVLNNVQL